jgi:hypothetical protein
MWTRHQQHQQRGAQFPPRTDKPRQSRAEGTGGAPDEATRDRAAQEQDRTGHGAARPGGYPASRLEDRTGDPAPERKTVEWDTVVQPERRRRDVRDWDEEPLPEGK